jgi:hypothetical protein
MVLGLNIDVLAPVVALWNLLKIAVPVTFVAIGALLAYKYFTRTKAYNIDIEIIIETDGNFVSSSDKGGIVKTLSGEKLILQKRNKTIPVPPRKYWVLREGGRFKINLYRYGEDEFNVMKLSPITEFRRILGKDNIEESAKDDLELEPIDVKTQLKLITDKVAFVPTPSDSKSHFIIQTRENVIKHQQAQGFMEKNQTVIAIGMLSIVFLMMIFWGFGFTEKQLDKGRKAGLSCITESQEVLKSINKYCLAGDKPPTGQIPIDENTPKSPI